MFNQFIFIQIILGAFVSGLDAGNIYQTWPKMGDSFFPDDILYLNLKIIFDFENHSLVQFYHRNLAYFIVIYVLILTVFIVKNRMIILYSPLKILFLILFLQASLGILTLISDINIFIASFHQITSVLLIFSALNLYYLRAK